MKYIYLSIVTLFLSFTGLAQNSINSSKGQKSTTSVVKVIEPDADRSTRQVSGETETSPLQVLKGKKEDLSKRDVYSKHFVNTDGSYTALIGAGPIHYKKDGQFYDIDLNLKSNMDAAYPYANTTNLFESYFGATAHKGIKNKTVDGEVKEFLNTKMYWEVNGQAVNSIASANTAITVLGDKAYYNNMYGTISAEFVMESGRRKLNYIIPNASSLGTIPTGADYLTFTEDIILQDGWMHSVTERGILIKNKIGKAIYLYSNPISTDAASALKRDRNTVFETSLNGNVLTVMTKVNTSWLLSAEREYPVKVDPTVNVDPDNVANWTGHVWSDGYYDNATIYTGYYDYTWIQGALRFNLSSIPDGATVDAATGYINILGGYGTGIASNTWALVNCSDPLGISVGYNAQATALYNSMTAAHSQTTSVTSLGWRSSLFSPSGKTYLEDAIVNDFVTMGLYAMGTYNNGAYFETADRTSADRPYISIDYTVSTACSGTPTGGTASLTATSGTFGASYTGSVTGSSFGAGTTYQWESAPTASGPWTSVFGATGDTHVFTAPSSAETIYYRREITCTNSFESEYSSVVSFWTYACAAAHSEGNCAGVGDCQYIGISNVNLGTINNTTGFSNVSPAYNYYSGQTTDVEVGNNYDLKVTYKDNGAPANPGELGAWIDWNGDGDFSGLNEFLGITTNVANNAQITFNFTVPAGATSGTKIMRIRSVYNDEGLTLNDYCTEMEYGETEDYNVNVLVPSSITYTYNGSWSPSDPNGVAAASDDIVIATGDAAINTNTTCNNVTVNPGAGLTVATGVTLTATNGVLLESSSTSYSSLIRNGSIAGTIEYERHVNINGTGTTGNNDLISAPLTGQTFANLALENPNILNNGTLYLFGPFDKVIGDYVTWAGTETTTLEAGVGYRAATSDNSVVTFTGTAENGTVINDIDNSGPSENEWNLVGNPYPSYINVQDFFNHEISTGVTNLSLMNAGTAAIYGYDGSAQNGWTIYNLANTTTSTIMAPGQGFFLSADATKTESYNLEFTPNMRRTGSGDDFILGRNPGLVYLALNISSNNKSYDTDFYFNSNASEGFDLGYDAEIWGGTAPDFGIYSHLVQDNAGQPMALQTLNVTNLEDVSIPLGVNANQGEQITFSIADMTLPTSVNVYLEDEVANTITLLNNSDYVFTPTIALSGTGRFFLRFSSEALSNPEESINDLQIYTTATTRTLFVKGQLATETTISLYDIQGRMISSSVLDTTSNSNQVDVSNLSSGVYVVKLNNATQQKTQKVIIK